MAPASSSLLHLNHHHQTTNIHFILQTLRWSYSDIWLPSSSPHRRFLTWTNGCYINFSPGGFITPELFFHSYRSSSFISTAASLADLAMEKKHSLWRCGTDIYSPLPEQSQFWKAAGIQTVVCIHSSYGVLELGSMELVPKDCRLLQELENLLCPEVPQEVQSQPFPLSRTVASYLGDLCEDNISSSSSSRSDKFSTLHSAYPVSSFPNDNTLLDDFGLCAQPSDLLSPTSLMHVSMRQETVACSLSFNFSSSSCSETSINQCERFHSLPVLDQFQTSRDPNIQIADAPIPASLGLDDIVQLPETCHQSSLVSGSAYNQTLTGDTDTPIVGMHREQSLYLNSAICTMSSTGAFKPYSWARTTGSERNRYRNQGDGHGSLLKKCLLLMLPGIQQSAQVQAIKSNAQVSLSQYDQAHQHIMAERRRRSKQSECLLRLRNLVPGITKRDKVTILESTHIYLSRLQSEVNELRKQKTEVDHSVVRELEEFYHGSQLADSTQTSHIECTRNYFHTVEVTQLDNRAGGTVFSIDIESSKSLDGGHTLSRLIACLETKSLQTFSARFKLKGSTFCANLLAQAKEESSNGKPTSGDIKEDLDKVIWSYSTS